MKIIAILLSRVNHWAETVSLLENSQAGKIKNKIIEKLIAKN